MQVTITGVEKGDLATKEVENAFDQIHVAIQDVVTSSDKAVSSIYSVEEKTNDIYHAIDKVSEMAEKACEGSRQVAATTQEQLATSEEIAAASQELAKMSEDLSELIKKFKV
ncbi:MAG: hypothetical protein ACQEWW_17390 [Bacillota bacterium]